jgi:transaldolase
VNALRELLDLGQSIWYDNINREMLTGGDLAHKVSEGLTGVTSNPSIFDKAITTTKGYDEQIQALLGRTPRPSTGEMIQELMITDITAAADILRPVYSQSHGQDGFVSIEVTPSKARNAAATMEECRYLWKRIARPNLMVKIPATVEGLPAIRAMLAEGININVTLLFSVERYEAVADAYLSALEQRVADGLPLEGVASVASVFVSRIDTMVDPLLEQRIASGDKECATLLGAAAVANTQMVYQAFRKLFTSQRFAALAARGAHVQRPLWGSTGTKNPAYSDLKYVEPLVGPNTVNTVPPATYVAIIDHAKPVRAAIEQNIEKAAGDLAALERRGISMREVTHKLELEGVASFEKAFDGLTAFLERKRST